MKRWRILGVSALVWTMLLTFANAQSFEGFYTRQSNAMAIAPGVEFCQYALTPLEDSGRKGQRLYMLSISRDAPVYIVGALGASGVHQSRAAVSKFLEMAGEGALAGVNADFFDTVSGGPLGDTMIAGRWVTAGEFSGWAVGFAPGATPVIAKPRLTMTLSAFREGERVLEDVPINALNALRADIKATRSAPKNALNARRDNLVVLYTPDFSTSTHTARGGVEVMLDAGENVLKTGRITARVESISSRGDTPLETGHMVLSACKEGAEAIKALAVGDTVEIAVYADAAFDGAQTVGGGGRPDGGPLLVYQGAPAQLPPDGAVVDDYAYFYGAHPRTVVGVRPDGSYFFLLIEGNRAGCSGMTLAQAARVAMDLGAVMALNLDGGPSSTLALNKNGRPHAVSNTTGGGSETRVGSAFILCEVN